ncbi:hypothetical protein LEP1GSC064_0897 [Leptospira kirschneri serovar Grippotyphosa str. Moskva]|nr:hypothetical protein LEP1GSC064_0897 [Leptospira kirschneri serovar Grippotyphosa str. Moskva]
MNFIKLFIKKFFFYKKIIILFTENIKNLKEKEYKNDSEYKMQISASVKCDCNLFVRM